MHHWLTIFHACHWRREVRRKGKNSFFLSSACSTCLFSSSFFFLTTRIHIFLLELLKRNKLSPWGFEGPNYLKFLFPQLPCKIRCYTYIVWTISIHFWRSRRQHVWSLEFTGFTSHLKASFLTEWNGMARALLVMIHFSVSRKWHVHQMRWVWTIVLRVNLAKIKLCTHIEEQLTDCESSSYEIKRETISGTIPDVDSDHSVCGFCIAFIHDIFWQ